MKIKTSNSSSKTDHAGSVRRAWRWWCQHVWNHQAGPAGWRQVHTTPLSLAHQGVMVSMTVDDGTLWLRLSLLADPERIVRRRCPADLDPWRLAEVLDRAHAELRT